jgi:hypothetical protein
MRAIYYIRVFFVSSEFMAVLSGLAIYILFGDLLANYFSALTLNSEFVKWLMLFPIGISGWTLKEGVGVIFPNDKNSKILHEWSEYWKLKAHFDIGVLNSILYLLPCLAFWMFGTLKGFDGIWAFFVFAVALSLNAFSFYNAKISVKSILIRIDKEKNSNERVY